MRYAKKSLLGAVGTVLIVGATTGCSSVEISPPIKSCQNYRVESGYGNFSIQQAGKGRSLQ